MKTPTDPSLPIGGTTGLSHVHSAAVDVAAAWLAARPPCLWPAPIIPELHKLFELSPADACATIREANRLRGDGRE